MRHTARLTQQLRLLMPAQGFTSAFIPPCLTPNFDVQSSTINRVKHLMPWLLSTGDDDGTIKVSKRLTPLRNLCISNNVGYRSGILVSEIRSKHTRSTSTILRISCGLKIRSSWLLPGGHPCRWRITIAHISIIQCRWNTLCHRREIQEG